MHASQAHPLFKVSNYFQPLVVTRCTGITCST